MLLKASKPSKPSTHRWAEIRKRLPSSTASVGFPWRACTRRPLAAKERVQCHCTTVPPYYLYFRQLFARQQRFYRQGIPGTTRVRKPLFAPFAPFACRVKGFRMLVGCSCFVGHSSSVPHVLDSCPRVLVSSRPHVLTSSAALMMMLPCHTSQPQSPPPPFLQTMTLFSGHLLSTCIWVHCSQRRRRLHPHR